MVGRDQESRKFAALSSNDHGLIIVEGNIPWSNCMVLRIVLLILGLFILYGRL